MNRIDTATATTPALLAFFNEHTTGAPVKRFADRATAVKRVDALLAALAPSPMTAMVAAVTKDTKPAKAKAPAQKTAKVTKTAKAPKSAKAPTLHPKTRFSADGIITIVAKGNPKKGTAADRYELYRTGMTVAAYIAAGGQRRDVVWDSAPARAWISVKG